MCSSNLRQIEQRIHQAPAIGFESICFRNVRQEFATRKDLLSTEGSRRIGGRFNFKSTFGVLYLSCDFDTCWEETIHTARASALELAHLLPRTIVSVEVKLSRVLDLINSDILNEIDIDESVLKTTDWKRIQNIDGVEAITQSIGRFAQEVEFEALLVSSAVWNGKNLDIFPDNLLPSAQISVVNVDQLAEKRS